MSCGPQWILNEQFMTFQIRPYNTNIISICYIEFREKKLLTIPPKGRNGNLNYTRQDDWCRTMSVGEFENNLNTIF
jgi:hypothetical protein